LHGLGVVGEHLLVLGELLRDFDPGESELSLHQFQPVGHRGIIAVDDDVACLRVDDPTTREAGMVVVQAPLEELGVLTLGDGQVLQHIGPELAM
jgi:hypothetical protein